MLDKMARSERFFHFYPNQSRREIARIFCVTKGTVTGWANRGTVPWSKLKYLSDSQAVSWDWLIEGWEPSIAGKEPVVVASTTPEFDTRGINDRYLSLFPTRSQTALATTLEVTPTTVHLWMKYKKQVPWYWLDKAVHLFGVSWNWLIDGGEPQYWVVKKTGM